MPLFNSDKRQVRKLAKIADKIEALVPKYKAMSDEDLALETQTLKKRLADGETLDKILPEAYANIREAAERVLGMRHFYVQLLGGIALHQGRIAEMATGEGKTLVATLPAYLNALEGKGVHVVTVNDYLATRDAAWMGKVYKFLGLSVGVVTHGMTQEQKREAYNCDITYCTNNELAFDFLRDNMVVKKEQKVQRNLNFAIVDEVDSVLIDEVRTPLVLSGQSNDSGKLYKLADAFARKCTEAKKIDPNNQDENNGARVRQIQQPKQFADKNGSQPTHTDGDFIIEEKEKTIMLTDMGVAKAEDCFKVTNLTDLENADLYHNIQQALKAHYIMRKNKDYIVSDKEILIVDEFTGRIMVGRRYTDGLHQAIEAKEGVDIRNENKTLATITYQNFFRMYSKLSGMTGTAKTEEEEFKGIYSLDVVSIPPNKPSQRRDEHDKIYKTTKGKLTAIVGDILESHKKGTPVLVGTVSVEKSEELSDILDRKGVAHNVLNAKFHKQEAEIIAQAGRFGAITIATNMAGRGTDIMLGGNPDFQAKYKMEKDGYPLEIIELASSPHDSDDEEVIKAKEVYKHHYDAFKAICDEEKKKVVEAGGLRIIGTERHESRRIDNQLRGRAGRQGDPGSTVFYISMEDDVARIFGGDKMKHYADMLNLDEDTPISNSFLTKNVERAQRMVESRNYSIRKQVLSYDDVMNVQRELIYKERGKVLDGLDVHDQILDMIDELAEDVISTYADYKTDYNTWDYEAFNAALELKMLPEGTNLMNPELCSCYDVYKLKEAVLKVALADFNAKVEKLTSIGFDIKAHEREMLLRFVDMRWMEHIDAMDALRRGIGLRGYGQRDPVIAYRQEGWEMFEDMVKRIHLSTAVYFLKFNIELEEDGSGQFRRRLSRARRTIVVQKKVGRNEPCPCGSGLKYKNCCGKNTPN